LRIQGKNSRHTPVWRQVAATSPQTPDNKPQGFIEEEEATICFRFPAGGTFESSVWIFWRRGVCGAARFGPTGSSLVSTERRRNNPGAKRKRTEDSTRAESFSALD
ncbi:hypothetical protein CCH79_00017866, partial [Gambusia affinis]